MDLVGSTGVVVRKSKFDDRRVSWYYRVTLVALYSSNGF